MRRRVAALVLVAVLTVTPGASAETEQEASADGNDKVNLLVARRESRSKAEARIRRRKAQKPVERYIQVAELRFNPQTGEQCVRFFYVEGDAEGFDAAVADFRVNNLEPCPDQSTRPATPAEAALEVWRRHVQLPTPSLNIEPGWAITGKRAYLEIHGDRNVAGDFVGLGYPVSIRAASTFDVDWGDGTIDRGIASSGGPYPDGDVTHVYQDTGTYTVTVTQRWTADWRIGTQAGTITEPLFTVAEFELPVRQVQAVRDR